MYTPRMNWVLFVLFALAAIGVFVATLISPTFREIAYAPVREMLIPPPAPMVVSVLYSTENVAMFALTVAAGLCSAWWLAPVGFVFWLVMVIIVIARDPGMQITFMRQSRQPLSQRYQTASTVLRPNSQARTMRWIVS